MTMIAVETRKVGLEEVDERYSFLRLCDQKKLLRLRESVKGEGVRNPIVVSDGIEEGKLVVVDGFKRLRVAKESGFKEIEVRVMTVNAASLHAALLACNRPEKGVSDLEEGWVVQSLHRRHQMSQVSIGKLLSRHKSWVCRRLKMVEHLEDGIQEEIRLGLLTVSMARELCRLPRGNQIEVARSIQQEGLSTRQASSLVAGFLTCDDAQVRRALLADPLRYLTAQGESRAKLSVDPRLSAQGNQLREILLTLQGKLYRLVLACRTYAPAGLMHQEREILRPLVEECIGKTTVGLGMMKNLLDEGKQDEKRKTQAVGLRDCAAILKRGDQEGDSPVDGDRPQDGTWDIEAGGETAQ